METNKGVSDLRIIAEGLKFPEGPVALKDGSVVVVECAAGRITRVHPDGTTKVVSENGGAPNGLAIGPDGKLYVCNNGGSFTYVEEGGLLLSGPFDPKIYSGGRIERVDLDTGEVEILYRACGDRPLRSPDDIVFDAAGGFYFTDFGVNTATSRDLGVIYYALPDGSAIRAVATPLDGPNGVALSPDGKRLYATETNTGRVFWWDVSGPGQLVSVPGFLAHGGTLLRGLGGERQLQGIDSMKVDGEGWACVGTLVNGGITAVSPDGEQVEF